MAVMGRRALALLLGLALVGCTRVIDDATPQRERPIGPIDAGQVEDLVSKNGRGGDAGASLYAKVEPADCAGLVQEVRAPFVFDAKPVAHSGGFWHDVEAPHPGNIVEIVGVYHSDFDPAAALGRASRTIEACRGGTVTAAGADGEEPDDFRVLPQQDSGSPQIILWSMSKVGWACDNAFVAAHNAAIEMTACDESNGYDVLALAQDALKRIEALANATT
jgi:hypothetical protein